MASNSKKKGPLTVIVAAILLAAGIFLLQQPTKSSHHTTPVQVHSAKEVVYIPKTPKPASHLRRYQSPIAYDKVIKPPTSFPKEPVRPPDADSNPTYKAKMRRYKHQVQSIVSQWIKSIGGAEVLRLQTLKIKARIINTLRRYVKTPEEHKLYMFLFNHGCWVYRIVERLDLNIDQGKKCKFKVRINYQGYARKGQALAVWTSGFKALTIPLRWYSEQWLFVFLMHELGHAWGDIHGTMHNNWNQEEFNTHSKDCSRIARIFPAKYQQLLAIKEDSLSGSFLTKAIKIFPEIDGRLRVSEKGGVVMGLQVCHYFPTCHQKKISGSKCYRRIHDGPPGGYTIKHK